MKWFYFAKDKSWSQTLRWTWSKYSWQKRNLTSRHVSTQRCSDTDGLRGQSSAVVRAFGCRSDGPGSILHRGWTWFRPHFTSRWSIWAGLSVCNCRNNGKWCGTIKTVKIRIIQGRHDYTCRYNYPLFPVAVLWVKGRVARSWIGKSAR